jgi:hypothetical protein
MLPAYLSEAIDLPSALAVRESATHLSRTTAERTEFGRVQSERCPKWTLEHDLVREAEAPS